MVAVSTFSKEVMGISSFVTFKFFCNEIMDGWKEKKLLFNEFGTCRHFTLLN